MTHKKTVALASVVTVVIVLVTIGLTALVLEQRDQRYYPSNFYIQDVPIGGYTRVQAEQNLSRWLGRPVSLRLRLPDKVLVLAAADYGVDLDTRGTLARVEQALHPDKGLTGSLNHVVHRGRKQNIPARYQCNREILSSRLQELLEKHNQPAVNARIVINQGSLEYIPEQNGYLLDIESTCAGICTALQNGSLDIQAEIINIEPAVKMKDIKAVKEVIGAYAAAGISETVLTRMSTLDGTIIMPGQLFTWQPEQTGSLPAGIEPALQAVTNALEDANLKIQSYPRPENNFTLIVQNQLTRPVFVSLTLPKATLMVRIWGSQSDEGKKILLLSQQSELPPTVKTKVDASLKPLEQVVKQQGTPGTVIRTYRVVTRQGQQIEKTLLAEEIHMGTETIIGQGPGDLK